MIFITDFFYKDQNCMFKPDTVGATDTGFTDISSGDEDALTSAIATVGPISVGIDASQGLFNSNLFYQHFFFTITLVTHCQICTLYLHIYSIE